MLKCKKPKIWSCKDPGLGGWAKQKNGVDLIAQQQIKSPCTTTSMPFDFNPNQATSKPKGSRSLFSESEIVPWCLDAGSLCCLRWKQCDCTNLGVSFTMTHLETPPVVLPFSTTEFLITSAFFWQTCKATTWELVRVDSFGCLKWPPPLSGGLQLTSMRAPGTLCHAWPCLLL